MSSAVSANRLELLQVAEAVAREKLIDKELVLEALEEAIQKAARSRYGVEHDIRTVIDRENGDIRLYRVITVVDIEEIENETAQLSLEEAQKSYPSMELEIGSEITEELPPMDFGRIAAQTAKQVITQKVRDAERDRQFEEYKDRANEVTNGIVKRVEYGNVVVDLGRAETVDRRQRPLPPLSSDTDGAAKPRWCSGQRGFCMGPSSRAPALVCRGPGIPRCLASCR